MSEARGFLVPAALHRVRCFLNTEGRLRARPWAPPEEILDTLHDALRSRRGDERFWEDLGGLMGALVEDASRRASPGSNPFAGGDLEAGRRAAVLAEIRAALASRRRGRGRFRRLARAMSAPAVTTLLLLGGVATLGCYGSTSDVDDVAGETAPDARDDAGGDDASPDRVPDGAPDEASPEVADDAGLDAEAACDAAGRTLEDILAGCGLPDGLRTRTLACVGALHASWRTGLTEMFACDPGCEDLWWQIDTCLLDARCTNAICGDPAAAGAFDREAFLDGCCVLLYLGVRFE